MILKLGSPLFASSTPSQEAVPLLRHRTMNGTLSWGNFSPCFLDNFFIRCYWEWLKDILGRSKEKLIEWRLYNGLYASLFSYNMSANILKVFCELRCHTINTFCTENDDMSISLWDMQIIGGLPADKSYYEEVVPSARELLFVGYNNKPLMTCTFLFSTFHKLWQDVNGVL